MKCKTVVALLGAVVLAVAVAGAALAASAGPAVTLQVKTLSRTLKNVVVHGEKGSVTKGGGSCSGRSGAGALDAATHGNWTGKYYKGQGIFVTSILGVKPKNSHYYWGIYVNGKSSSTGACGIKLHANETILFKITKT
jgi:hypothetical protein